MIRSAGKLVGFLALLLILPGFAEQRRDPLNPLEVDQLRDAAQDPTERLKLYVIFARTRLAALDKVRSGPKAADRAQQTHDRLQDFLDVYDEMNDNIDTFVERKSDLRKALKLVVEADTEFQAKLRAVKTSIESTKDETSLTDFLLTNALDTVDSSIQDHRQLLAEQEEAAKRAKKK